MRKGRRDENKEGMRGAGLAESVEHATLDLRVVSSSPRWV